MERDYDRLQRFSRRSFIMAGLQTSAIAILVGRLGWLQLAQKERYFSLSENNRVNTVMIPPERGLIFDRSGTLMALNEQDFRVQIIPEEAGNLEETLEKVGTILDLRPSEKLKVIERAAKQAKFVPISIRNNLDWEQVSAIEVNLPELPGVSIGTGLQRVYTYGKAGAHTLGYVGAVAPEDLNDDPLLASPDFRIGKTGLEKSMETLLRGKPGFKDVEVNVSGRVIQDLKIYDSIPGAKTVLTVQANFQQFMQNRLAKEKSAAAIVMDAHTGAIYGMCSSPSFDPHLFIHGMSNAQWKELSENPGKPFNNKVISGQYPPGSTFKMITALAALEEGIVTSRTRHTCYGQYELNNDKIYCWKRRGHGSVDIISAISESCDVYFYNIAQEIGIEKIAEMAKRFGLGQSYNFVLQNEKPGLIPDKNWKMAQIGEKWRPGETIIASIGQGYVLATPLQLAVMTSRLVNGGYAVKPWMVGAVNGKLNQNFSRQWPKISIKQSYLDVMLDGMNKVVNSEDGTAHASMIEDISMRMGGKTGTSQVKGISDQERSEGITKQEDQPWKYRDHALFVGYAPVNNPRYVCSVIVEHGGSGSAAAAPIARDLMTKIQEIDPASQKLNAFPDPEKSVYTLKPSWFNDEVYGPQLPEEKSE